MSEWFRVNSRMESVKFRIDQTKCKEFSIESAKVLLLEFGQPKSFSLELKKTTDESFVIFEYAAFKDLFKNIPPKTMFKLVLEVKSQCDKLIIWPLTIGPELACPGGDKACGGKTVGKCDLNYADGSAKCKCSDSKYFGENCELSNPCKELKVRILGNSLRFICLFVVFVL